MPDSLEIVISAVDAVIAYNWHDEYVDAVGYFQENGTLEGHILSQLERLSDYFLLGYHIDAKDFL